MLSLGTYPPWLAADLAGGMVPRNPPRRLAPAYLPNLRHAFTRHIMYPHAPRCCAPVTRDRHLIITCRHAGCVSSMCCAQVPWTPEVIALPGASERCGLEGDGMLWRGPRVKMGVYQGRPAKVGRVTTLFHCWKSNAPDCCLPRVLLHLLIYISIFMCLPCLPSGTSVILNSTLLSLDLPPPCYHTGSVPQVTPHSTTGRADYFGPLVNRAARFCHAAAQGGQVGQPSQGRHAAV